MIKFRRSLIAVAAFLFVCIIVISSVYVICQSEHDCCGEECSVCVFIHECITIFTRFSAPLLFAVLFVLCLYVTFLNQIQSISLIIYSNPVSFRDKILC